MVLVNFCFLFFCCMQIAVLQASVNLATECQDSQGERVLNGYFQSLGLNNEIISEHLCEPLLGLGGASMYRFVINDHSYVLRIFKPELRRVFKLELSYFNGARQIISAKLAGDIGVGPIVRYIDPALSGYVMDFIHGRTVRKEDFSLNNYLANFASTLKRLHSSKAPFPGARNRFEMFRSLVAEGGVQATPYPTRFNDVIKVADEIEELLRLHFVPSVPIHYDLHSQNVMLEDGRFFFIDWEDAGLGDPYFDLSRLPLFLRFNETEEKQFLHHYFNRPPSQFEWDRYVVAQPINLLFGLAFFLSGPAEDRTTEFYDEMLEQKIAPDCSEIFCRHEKGNLDFFSRWEIGLGIMQGWFELVESERFQASFERLYNDIGREAQIHEKLF